MRAWWLAVAGATVLLLGLLALIISGYPGRDSSAFIYVADGLLAGELPYADRWDHKGPLVYLVNAAGRLLTPDAWNGIHALELLSLVACGALGFGALRPAFGAVGAALGMLVAGLAVAALVGPGNFTEEWALLPQFAALYLFTRVGTSAMPDRRQALAILAIGALGAAAFLLRPNLIGVWLAIGAAWLLFDGARLKRLGLALTGGVLTLLAAALVLFATDAWDSFYDAVFEYNRAYSSDLGPIAWLGRSLAWLSPDIRTVLGWQVIAIVVLAWIAAVASLVRPGNPSPASLRLVRWAALAVPIETMLIAASDRTYEHYYLALVPVLAVLAGFVTTRVSASWRRLGHEPAPGRRHRQALLASALGVAWLTLLVVTLLRPTIAATRTYDLPVHELAARYLKAQTLPSEPVLVWGAESLVYLLAERDAASRFFYHLPLVTAGYATDEVVSSFVEELAGNMPAVIIDVRDPRLPPLDPLARSGHEQAGDYPVDPATLRPVLEFVEEGYERGPDLGPWATYQRR